MSEMNITAQRGHLQALAFARQGGKELSGMLATIADTKETERKGPIQVFAFLVQHDVQGIPVPGSKIGETGNLPYDKYTTTVKTADGERKVPGSWYTDAVKATDEGKHIDELLPLVDGGEGAPEEYQKMGAGERAVEKKRLRDRIHDMRIALVKGCMLFLHAETIAAINPDRIKVKMPFKGGQDGKLTVYANTIRLIDPAGEFEDKVFTVSEFLRIDPAKLTGKSEDQTIVSLENTKAKAPRTSGKGAVGKGKQDIKPAATVEDLLNLFNVAATSIDTKTEQGDKLMAKLLAKCAAPGKEGDDAVETVGDFCCAIDDNIWSVINARYNKIKTDKAKAANQAAANANKTAA